jgi:hypothetical protein
MARTAKWQNPAYWPVAKPSHSGHRSRLRLVGNVELYYSAVDGSWHSSSILLTRRPTAEMTKM